MARGNFVWLMTCVAAAVLLSARLVFVEGQLPTAFDTNKYDEKKVAASKISAFLEEEKFVEFLGGILRISNLTKPKVVVNGRMLVKGTMKAASISVTRDVSIGNLIMMIVLMCSLMKLPCLFITVMLNVLIK